MCRPCCRPYCLANSIDCQQHRVYGLQRVLPQEGERLPPTRPPNPREEAAKQEADAKLAEQAGGVTEMAQTVGKETVA